MCFLPVSCPLCSQLDLTPHIHTCMYTCIHFYLKMSSLWWVFNSWNEDLHLYFPRKYPAVLVSFSIIMTKTPWPRQLTEENSPVMLGAHCAASVTEAFLKPDIWKGNYFRNYILMSWLLSEHFQGLCYALRNMERGNNRKKDSQQPGSVGLTYNPSTWKNESKGHVLEARRGYRIHESLSLK